jgi:parallel beta-helix repeat protein
VGDYNVSLTVTNLIGNNTFMRNIHVRDNILSEESCNLTSGIYNTTRIVKLTTNDSTNTIYYTVDSTDPRTSSTRIQYTGPITISKTTTLRYAAVTNNGRWSLLCIRNYVIGTGGLADTPSPTYQINSSHNGQSKYTGPQTKTIKWIINNTSNKDNNVSIGPDGTIYCGNYAIYPNGIVKWIISNGGSVPTIGSDGTIYYSSGSYSGKLCAVNPDGTVKWEYPIDGGFMEVSPAIGADGTIYIGSRNGVFYAINPNGTLKWSKKLNDSDPYAWISGTAALGSDGTIYVATYHFLHALWSDGTEKWSYYIGNHQYSTPTVGSDGTIYIGTHDALFYAFNPDGTLKWTFNTKGVVYESAAIASDGTIYVIDSIGTLYALNPDGTLKWSCKVGNCYYSPLIGLDGTIYLGTNSGVFAVGSDGIIKWSYTGNIGTTSNPVIDSEGTLYLGTSKGVYAFNDHVANYIYNIGSNPLCVGFTDVSTDAISWFWDFGDGTTSTKQNPTHTYVKSGQYMVNLTAILASGYIRTATKIITISDVTPPSVVINPLGKVFKTTQTVTITATDNSGNVTIYYTVDGSDPLISSTRRVYTGPITLTKTTTLSYVAVDSSNNHSPVYDETFEQSDSTINVVYVPADYTNDQIQAILNTAEPGSTIEFLGLKYADLHLIIDKPLNIISNVGTVITSSNSSAVFQFEGTTNSKISGFTIINTETGPAIRVNYSSNVTVSNDKLSSNNGTAVIVNGSTNITIKSSTIFDSLVGINVSDSDDTQISKNNIYNNSKGINVENSGNTTINKNQILNNQEKGIYVSNSSNTTISANTIENNGNTSSNGNGVYIEGSSGVHIENNEISKNSHGLVINNVTDVFIEDNDILDNDWNGMTINGFVRNINILSNIIQKNSIGIQINCKNENLSLKGNLITDNTVKSGDKNHSGFGIDFGSNFVVSSSFLVEHNIIWNNAEMDFHGCSYHGDYLKGSNWFGTYCKQIDYDPPMIMVLTRSGEKAFTVKFYDGVTGKLVKDFPSVIVSFTMATAVRKITAIEGVATAVFDSIPLVGQIIATCYGHTATINYNSKITPLNPDDGSNNNNTNTGHDSGNGENSHGGNPGTGDNPGSGHNPGSGGSGSNNGGSSTNNSGSNTNINNNHGTDPGSPANGGSDSKSETVPNATNMLSYSSMSLSSAGDSPSEGSSSSNQNKPTKTVQEIIVNNMTHNGNIWGIIEVIIILMGVILAYYRKDIMSMIRKSRK